MLLLVRDQMLLQHFGHAVAAEQRPVSCVTCDASGSHCDDENQEHGGAPQGGRKAGGNIYIEEARLQRVHLRGTMY